MIVQTGPKIADERMVEASSDGSTPPEQREIIDEAKERYNIAIEATADSRKLILEDLKFAEADSDNGYQWPNDIKKNRDVDARPSLTINIVRQHNLNIINDAKQNKPGIVFRPTGNGATYESAQALNALVRQIEYRSNATVAYDTATSFQVKGGLGWLRVKTAFVDDKTMNQEILIERVIDPLSILSDPDAKDFDRADSNWCFIFEDFDRKEAEKKYPQYKNLMGTAALGSDDGWLGQDKVRFCEYYRRVEQKDTLYAYPNKQSKKVQYVKGSMIPAELRSELDKDESIKKRETSEWIVEWYFIIGNTIVESEIFPGKYIPIVPVIGEEITLDGRYICKGHTRNMKDPQRMYNYWSPLRLSEKIPVPSGWKIMGEIQVGDQVLNEKGEPVDVIGLSPIYHNRKCFLITFDDGATIAADEEHLWEVEERGKRKGSTWDWQIKTVKTNELTPKKHFIFVTKPLQLSEKRFSIDPYVLGIWLGDGRSSGGQISQDFSDVEELASLVRERGYIVSVRDKKLLHHCATMTIHGLTTLLDEAGLVNNKHIPAEYLRGSETQRWALLQGLMDTDGNSNKIVNTCIFTTASDAIASGFSELLRSLGLKASKLRIKGDRKQFPNGKEYTTRDSWQFTFSALPTEPVFKLSRKKNLHERERITHWRRTKRHRIISVQEIESVPVRCLAVESAKHLFLAGEGMIPTHNSAATEHVALQGKTPYIASAEAIEEYEEMWNTANRVNYSVLIYNGMSDDGQPIAPPVKVPPPQMAPAYLTGMQVSKQDLMFVSGQYQNQLGEAGNERTGKAINERQRQGDTATYHFIDNLAIAIRHVGRIILGLIPVIYDTQQIIHILAEDGVSYEVMIDPAAKQAWQGEQLKNRTISQRILNPQIGMYDVQADIGPSWGTKREEAFNALTLILTQAPQLTSIIGDILLRNGDFAFADEAAERLNRMVPAQALGKGPSQQEQMLAQQLQAAKTLIAKLIQSGAEDKMKLIGKDQMREIDAYNAETNRLKLLVDRMGHTEELQAQLLSDIMNTNLEEVDAASKPELEQAAVQGSGNPSPSPEFPPHYPPGTKVGPGGQMYQRDYAGSPLFTPLGPAPQG